MREAELTNRMALEGRLQRWHLRLQAHFAALHRARSTSGGWPVFALEHDLSPDEVKSLEADVRAQFRLGSTGRNAWLPWIVYSAELGYAFSGQEYWPTFEENTPGWRNQGNKEWIRTWFRKFESEYGGVHPAGAWADLRNIICWPIANAILPRDLQLQLARILYELRYSPELLFSADTLGKGIRRQALLSAKQRFQEFTEDPALVGQIAFALLFQGEQLAEGLLLDLSLHRIVADLEQVQEARDWLHTARRNAHAVAVKGLQRPGRLQRFGDPSPTPHPREAAERRTLRPAEPRIRLVPIQRGIWEAKLEIPDLTPILGQVPGARDFLVNCQCTVSGSNARLARGALISYGTQAVTLFEWPKPGQGLLRFPPSVPVNLDFILKSECQIRTGPVWLFRIASDGCAYEVRNLVVRPNQRYIVVSIDDLPPGLDTTQISFRCSGVHAMEIQVPSGIAAGREAYYSQLGIQVGRHAEFWPAGMVAPQWDSEGSLEWIGTDDLCLGVRLDHAVESLVLQLGGESGQSLSVRVSEPGTSMFVQLPPLSVGVHRLQAHELCGDEPGPRHLGEMVINVRGAKPWIPLPPEQKTLFITLAPTNPSFEQFWANAVDVEVKGPWGLRVVPTIALRSSAHALPFYSAELPAISLPITPGDWRQWTDNHLFGDGAARGAAQVASSCYVEFDAGDLGRFSFECERWDKTLRWVLDNERGTPRLALRNAPPLLSMVSGTRYSFDTPDVGDQVEVPDPTHPLAVDDLGGLFVATYGSGKAGVVLPPELDQLREHQRYPQFAVHPHTAAVDVDQLLGALELWMNADTLGSAASAWAVQQVQLAAIDALFMHLLGRDWNRAELKFRSNPEPRKALRELAAATGGHRSGKSLLVGMIMDKRHELLGASVQERVSMLGILASRAPQEYVIGDGISRLPIVRGLAPLGKRSRRLPWLAEFVLRLASAPQTIRNWAGDRVPEGMHGLEGMPVFVRAARFMVLYLESPDADYSVGTADGLYPSWKWE